MKTLTVLYDVKCALCRDSRKWLEIQPAYFRIECIPAQSTDAAARYPTLVRPGSPVEELIVVSDEGGVYRGGEAWIMCLYALKEYRVWARRLSHPALLPFAKTGYEILSRNRGNLSRMLFEGWEDEVKAAHNAPVPMATLLDAEPHPAAAPRPVARGDSKSLTVFSTGGTEIR